MYHQNYQAVDVLYQIIFSALVVLCGRTQAAVYLLVLVEY